ncbi:acyl-CoA dehydrogenase family protein [Streptomyces sp. NBC_01239]|uniref:acyl-CoA dehydrogenase family protein n=1 Tax=Streptomyces sp. NBC_01239 TaxID=2903792 RepID=UPI0022512074|nr:acyl-CoA dehydrogenase family protein [Streptomyces sp. NBC_01239]MCX4815202.1 acyl-CoA dehydrogenase family protein [Streptomyces sp. NBC_01239]
MRLDATAELHAFRAEVRSFIRTHAPGRRTHAGVRAPEPALVPELRRWTARLYEAGYLGRSWPVEYGGLGDPRPEPGFVVAEELARARAWGQVGAGALASGALLAYGTDGQKRRFLARLRSGEDLWCQLFSEPEAGSDLAGLRTRARREGDHYVVDGQKVWTTNAQHADVGYLLARTDPEASRTRGITAFALDMRTPGVEIRPLREITGTADFNEVFLDGVRVPADRVIGEVGDGWKVAGASLAQERSSVAARSAELRNDFDDLLGLTAGPGTGGEHAPLDGGARGHLGRLATHVYVADLMSKDVQSRMAAGTDQPTDPAAVKIFYSETNLDAVSLAVRLQGLDGLLTEGDDRAVAGGYWQDALLYARAYTIAGGANEVLRTTVAERALGLPREPRP